MTPDGGAPIGRFRAWRAAVFVACILAVPALLGGCGEASAGDGPRSYIMDDGDEAWHIGWDGAGDGRISGSFRGTFYDGNSGEIETTEYAFNGRADGPEVTMITPVGDYTGEVEGEEFMLEYTDDDGELVRVRYREGSLEDYEQAAAEHREEGEALAEAGELVEGLSTDARLLEMQSARVEEAAIPLVVGGTEFTEDQVGEMTAALEDLRRASESYVEEEDPFCTDLPDLPVDTTDQDPPGTTVSDIEQLRGQIRDTRADLDALEEAERAASGIDGIGETKEEVGEELERAEGVEEAASSALDEFYETEESARIKILEMEQEEEEIEEELGC